MHKVAWNYLFGPSSKGSNTPELLPNKMEHPSLAKRDYQGASNGQSQLEMGSAQVASVATNRCNQQQLIVSVTNDLHDDEFIKRKSNFLMSLDDFRNYVANTNHPAESMWIEKEKHYYDMISNLKRQLSEKNAKIKELEEDLVKKEKSCTCMKPTTKPNQASTTVFLNPLPEPHTVLDPHEQDKIFRGNVTLDFNEKIEEQVSKFYGDNGLYTTLMDEAEDIGSADLGHLMVSFSMLSYQSAMNVSLRNAYKLLKKLFIYHPEITTDEEAKELKEVQHAYGLLLCCKSPKTDDVTKEIEQVQLLQQPKHELLYTSINNVLQGKQKKLFEDFYKETAHQFTRMVSISPPMVMHTQDTFDEKMARAEINKDPLPPLLWTQPVIMENWNGEIRAKGRADNEESLKAD